MSQCQIALPGFAINNDFDEIVRPLTEPITSAVYESRTLITLRDTVLPMVVTGAIRVVGVEQPVHEGLG